LLARGNRIRFNIQVIFRLLHNDDNPKFISVLRKFEWISS
jgi:hypothetical protein